MIALQEPKDMYTMAELRKANEAERALRERPDTETDPDPDPADYGW